jgi:hypothetical protein
MTRKYIVITSLVAFLATTFFGCENEDVIRTPDFIVPVILLAKTPDGSGAKAVDSDTIFLDQGNTYDFILEAEDFDGSEEGHQYFTGRDGVTSTLVDGQLYVQYRPAGAESSYGDRQPLMNFGPELNDSPVNMNVSLQQLADAFPEIADVDDIQSGDLFRIRYEYLIDANNTGTIREIGLPSNDYCGGFSFEGEFCSLFIPID